jgi:hypothetical protein
LRSFTDGAMTADSKVRARSSSRKAGERVTAVAILRGMAALNRLHSPEASGRVKI